MNHIIIFDIEGFQIELAKLYNDEVLTPFNVTGLFKKHLKSTTYREIRH